MGQSPHYLQGAENPAVKQTLLTYVSRLLGLELDVSHLDEDIKAFRARCDLAIAQDTSIREHVQELEREYDAASDEAKTSLRDDELNPDKLVQELEDFLREERGGEGERGGGV